MAWPGKRNYSVSLLSWPLDPPMRPCLKKSYIAILSLKKKVPSHHSKPNKEENREHCKGALFHDGKEERLNHGNDDNLPSFPPLSFFLIWLLECHDMLSLQLLKSGTFHLLKGLQINEKVLGEDEIFKLGGNPKLPKKKKTILVMWALLTKLCCYSSIMFLAITSLPIHAGQIMALWFIGAKPKM